MLLPIQASRLIDHSAEPPAPELPFRTRDWAGAVVLFAFAMIVALAALGADWNGGTTNGDRPPLPESTRMMVLVPLPR